MNPSIKTKQDRDNAREEYINNLRLQVSNLQKTENALSLLETTGSVPLRPDDMRTTNERNLDIERQKIDLRTQLSPYMDGTNTTLTIAKLSTNLMYLRFTANNID